MEIYYQYVRKRHDFGRWPGFTDEGAEMLADIRPNEEHAKEHIERSPVTTMAHIVPDMSEHEANTTAVVYATKAVNHVEGGWPKEVDYTEAEHVIRYRKKVEKDEEYIKSIAALGGKVEELVKANNAIDIYQEYFSGRVLDHSTEPPSARTLAVLRDPTKSQRGVQYLSWHPDGMHKVAVAHSILEFQQQPDNSPMSSYIWDISNSTNPEFELIPQSQLTSINFNLKDTSLVGAGQYNGQFVYFDVRKGSTPVEASPIERSHRDPIYDFAWLQSKTGTEAMSVSTDGLVLWWDIRKMGEPTETLTLKERGSETVLGAMSLEYNPQAGPTKFMIGSEQGNIISCNRKAKNPQDRVGASFPAHHGPVYGLVRNPFYPKFFLSIGDWTARIWNEDLKTPIMTSKYHSAYMVGGRWSPTRPGVFYTIKMDGCLDVWDYFYKQNEPTLQVQVTDQPLTSFKMMENGRVGAAGSADGATTILQFSDSLVDIQPNEKQAITSIFERETNREKNLEKALKEAKIKARKEAAKGGDAALDADLPPAEYEKFNASWTASQSFGSACWCQSSRAPGWQLCPVLGGNTSPQPDPVQSATDATGVVISEVSASTSGGDDWLELLNKGSSTASLQGWSLSAGSNPTNLWMFPSAASIPAGGTFLVYTKFNNAGAGSGALTGANQAQANFDLSSTGGTVVLLDPSGKIQSAIKYPEVMSKQTYGLPPAAVTASAGPTPASTSGQGYAFLATATPNAPNAAAAASPTISGLTQDPAQPTAGKDLPISAYVLQGPSPLDTVNLVYTIGFAAPTTINMTAGSGNLYTANIPGSALTAGSMVRWNVQASDQSGGKTSLPLQTGDLSKAQNYGTVVQGPLDSNPSNLPSLHWFNTDSLAATSQNGSTGSMWFLGAFYDNVATARHGVTALAYPKPKLKFKAASTVWNIQWGQAFRKKVHLNSMYYEPGQKSYIREAVAYQAVQEAGAPWAIDYYISVNMNNKFYGMFTLVEVQEDEYLARNNLSTAGALFKPHDVTQSNFRWDLPAGQVQYFYDLQTQKSSTQYFQDLYNFNQGIAGATAPGRVPFVFDNVNLPAVVNYMAVMALLLDQDRCTKNFNIYWDRTGTNEWMLLAEDLKSALGADSGLGGAPATDYCVLECQQWNSPLYCDYNHTQEITTTSPWTFITANFDLLNGRRLAQAGHRALRQYGPDHTEPSEGNVNATDPEGPVDTPTADLTKDGPINGTASTFNYLIDTILAIPDTRAMYLRRLRTLMDQLTGGQLASIVTMNYNQVKASAEEDNSVWGIGDPTLGYEQLIQDQLPERKNQLYNIYGPGGPNAMIPTAQPSGPQLAFGDSDVSSGAGQYLSVTNPNAFAVDISGYKLQGDATLTLQPGVVIPAKGTLYLSPDVVAFRSRTATPKGGEGNFVQGSYSPQLSSGFSVTLVDPSGATAASP